ncbi:hypothetical protein V492_05256 [Pseudogymnoascus sp. VKM F-4246]|nr:hypothetical protein V492_05256 [Pseudogymnoascus sp. VKM F-4246]
MKSNNYNYGGNYPPINNRAPTSQQSFATSSATAGDPYYGQQPAATPTRTYPNNDYQYQQYPQQASANNGSGYNFGVHSGGNATPTTGMESLGNPSLPEPTPNTTTKSNAHKSHDTTGLGNLAYASGLSYNSGAETVQSTTRYSGGSVYEGSGRSSVAHRSTPSQGHDRTRPDNSGSRASPATGMHIQRHIPEQASGIKSGTAYNLPTPSPAYPQSLINSYPQRSANTTMPTGGTPVGSRASEASSGNVQSQYAPFTPSQPQKPATTRVFKQNQNRQTSTPPAAPVSRSTANASSNAYSNQPRSQAGRGPNSQSGRAIQTCPPPAATLLPAKMSANLTRRTGEGQTPTTQNTNSQANQYQPAPAPAPQLPPTSNYLPLPTQVSTARSQQLPQPQPQRRPSSDRPTTVDPSHVYNSYHEYQKQIDAAEAEAARLAELKEVAALDEQRRQETLRAQQQREREHMTGPAVQAAMTLAHTMPGDNAPESESVSEESDEDEQGQPSGGFGENKEQQATSAATSENISHQMAAGSVNPKGKAPSMLVPTTEPHEPPKDNTAVTMEEEMRRMVEKLRDYQSKDPKLFLQVWSSVRKTNTGQSPQPQAEGSQTQGSPVAQPSEGSLKSPTPVPATKATMAGPTPVPAPKATVAGPTPVPAHKATMVSTTPVPVPVPPPTSKGKKAAVQSPASTKSPSTQAAAEAREVANAKRRAKRASRSKAAKAERAAAELAEAKAKVAAATASATIPAAREPTLVTPSKPGAPESGGKSKPTMSTPRSTSIVLPPQKTSSSIATPAARNHAAANSRPANSTQQTPAGPSQVTGGVQRPSPAANTAPPRQEATWPTDKREAIAITAASVLNEIPENAGKKILSRQVRDMLEGNPSYLELCEMIEKLGFRMDRARFAKTLLSILPGGSKPRPQPPHPAAVTSTSGQTASVTAVIPPVTPGTTQTPSQTGQAPGSGTSMNGIERRPVGRPRKDGLPPGSPHGDSRTSRGPGRSQKPVPPVEIAEGPPNATATAATTAADTPASVATALPNAPSQPPLPTAVTTASPAPAVPEVPLTKEAQARKRTFAEIIDLTKGESSDKGEGNNEKRQRVDAGERTNNLSDMHGPDPPTTGELPTRPTQPKPVPFQHHHNQFTNTQSQNNVSNVIDNPRVPVTRNPLLEYDGIVKRIDRSLALRKSRYDPKTIARDILISAGKHPAQRSLNGHLKQLKEKFTKVDNTSDLSTFRWDIVDPGGAAVGSANMPPYGPNNTIKYPFPLTEAVPGRYDPSRPSGLRNETSNFAIVIRDGDGDEDDDIPDYPAPAPKRRGRRPRDPNAVKATPQRVLTRRNRRTPNDPVVPGEEEIELPPPKRRGRPAKEKAPERPLSRLSQPRYIPFLCEWRGCKAELMNLETLRKHVYVVHGKIISSKDFEAKPCLFAKCGKKSTSNAGDGEGDVEMGGVQQEEIYGDEEGFRAHVEKAHIIPIAWHLGDGPRGTTLGMFLQFFVLFLLTPSPHHVTPILTLPL